VHVLQCGLRHLHAADRGVLLRPERLRHPQAGHLPMAVSAPRRAEPGPDNYVCPWFQIILCLRSPCSERAPDTHTCREATLPRNAALKPAGLAVLTLHSAATSARVTCDRPRPPGHAHRWGFCGWMFLPSNDEVLCVEDLSSDARRAPLMPQSPASDCKRPANLGSMSRAGARVAL